MKFILLTIFIVVVLVIIYCKYFKHRNDLSKAINRTSINKWMSLSKDDRKTLDKKKQFNTMQRKQKLIKNIRKEYKIYKESK